MNLHRSLQERHAQGRPLRMALIGAGKFGSMFLSQLRVTPGMHLVAVADLAPERARAAPAGTGWPSERIAANSCSDALARVLQARQAHRKWPRSLHRDVQALPPDRPRARHQRRIGGLRREPTGAACGWRGDVVATAKRDLSEGEILDGEGGYAVYGKLMPAGRFRREMETELRPHRLDRVGVNAASAPDLARPAPGASAAGNA